MPISAARLAAFDILLRVQEQGAYASELLNSERLASLSTADRALCTELVMGALRWQSALDDDIQAVSSQKLNRMDAAVLVALRLGAYQLRFLDRVPAHAAVHESVELVKRARKRSAAPFANAVLRKLAGKYADGKTDAGFASDVGTPSAAASAHPSWLVERWVAEFGAERAQRICQFDQQAPRVALRMPPCKAETIEARLRAEGIELEPGRLLRSARVVLSHAGSPTRAAVARVGVEDDVVRASASLEQRLAIQDEGSQLVGALVGTGSRILDCCAAPGNKTAMLAEANPGATIVAVELHPHRAELLRKRMAALAGDFSSKLPAAASDLDAARPAKLADVEVLTADATALPYGREFDRVLADVPCSGTGTLARNPEIKWKLRPRDLADLHARQKAILAAALRHLAAGGVIVYATCSLEAEENAEVVEEVLHEHPTATLLDCRARLRELKAEGELTWTDAESLTSGPYLRTLPGTHPCDGFFAAMITV
jgi:16S rRNA (cytosine967-C5)-methyltransferase